MIKAGTCVHYTGMRLAQGPADEPCCKAGVNYREAFDDSTPGIFLRAPCIAYYWSASRPGQPSVQVPKDRKGFVEIPCALRREPTAEEIEADRVETEAAMRRVMLGIEVASRWRVKGKPTQNRQEVVECPACKGRLHLSQSAFNGHVHGHCETERCLSWME